jgi:hypothetical protein
VSGAAASSSSAFRVIVVAPVYRDWDSASQLCRELDALCVDLPGADVRVLLVDDGSPDGRAGWEPLTTRALRGLDVLVLKRNLGNQKALATALCHVHAHLSCDAVLVMDGDGEDRPEDAVRLIRLAMAGPPHVIFAERRRRLESPAFRAGYHVYRALHRVLTGVSVRVGNFSVLPAGVLSRLTCMPELWNTYVGAVFRSRLPCDFIPLQRGQRYRGRSHMDLVALVHHGLSGIATFQDVVATRILLATALGMALVAMALAAVIGIRIGTDLSIPGWATSAAGLLAVLFAQLFAIAFSMVFVLIAGRTASPFIPVRDCPIFVDHIEAA